MLNQVDPLPLAPFLDAWIALCALAGARSLRAAAAVQRPPAELEPLALALTRLGYPEATRGPRELGQTLRRLRMCRDTAGRWLDSNATATSRIWYVVTPVGAPAVRVLGVADGSL